MQISGTNITIIRGDTEPFVVDCMEDGKLRPFEIGDIIRFTVRWTESSETVYVQKEVTTFEDGVAFFVLSATDTMSLTPHTYRYDIEVTFADGTVKTVIGPSDFVVRGDVTR